MTNSESNGLIVAFNFPPSATAGVHRTLRFTRFLADSNWHVSVLTSLPDEDSRLDLALADKIPHSTDVLQVELIRPEDAMKDRIRNLRKADPRNDSASTLRSARQSAGCPVESIPTQSQGRFDRLKLPLGKLRRQMVELLFAIPDNRVGWKNDAVSKGLEIVHKNKISLVYATAPPFSSLLVGREIARQAGIPLVLDFRDPWTRVPWGPRNKSWLANRWVARLEEKCVRDAAAVILNTDELEQDFVKHYSNLPRERFVTIPNGFDPEIRSRVATYLEEATSLPQENRPFRLLHPGSLYRNRDPRPIVDAIANLKQRNVQVVLEQVGFCDPGFNLQNYAQQRGVADQVEVHPPVPHDQMMRRMAEVDGFVLLQPGTALQVPGKLFEMILFRKPILAICVPGAVSRIVNEFQIGTIADDGNVDSITKAILQMIGPDRSQPRWDDVAAEFDGEQLTSRLADVFDRVSAKPDSANSQR
ncbi:D-inositol-3-phosphate glycosyltransferase [Rubripirellula lacrimiformis]|uniref:D-inositol-3-phosphate glycosyltransferase n=2 Tax=Rubripirellula lacrimiformis TaxID=1930273 RepID=A0A517NGM1_9BACT|nr:D-inositol-3-phosphate glycosyltransferase [Rubripirellula lacrimiformis]